MDKDGNKAGSSDRRGDKRGRHRILKALACIALGITSAVLGVTISAWLMVTLAIHSGVTGATITALKLLAFGPAGLTGRAVAFVVVAVALAVGIYLGVYRLARAIARLVARRRERDGNAQPRDGAES